MGVLQQVLMSNASSVIYSTWNPSDKTSLVTLSNGNLTCTSTTSATNQGVRGTTSHSTGKYYFEVTLTSPYNSAPSTAIGIATSTWVQSNRLGLSDSVSSGYTVSSPGSMLVAGTNATHITATAGAVGNVIGVAVDITNHLIYFSLNGTWQNSAVPSSGTGSIDYITTSPIFPAAYLSSQASNINTLTLNVGASAFSNTPPSGFSAWG